MKPLLSKQVLIAKILDDTKTLLTVAVIFTAVGAMVGASIGYYAGVLTTAAHAVSLINGN